MSLQKHRCSTLAFSAMMRFAGWLQTIPNRVTPPPFRLIQISSSFWQSRALYVVTRLDIASLLADQPLDSNRIAERVSAQPDAVYRLLRMLAASGIFDEVTPGVFANNALSEPLRDDSPNTVRAMILMHNSEEMSRPWFEQLERSVREGGTPFKRAHGQELFEYMDQHPEFDALFSRAMDCVESLSGDSFAQEFDWGRFERVLDIGGSKGSKSIAILKRHPQLKALVVDREQVVRDAGSYWSGREQPTLLQRLSFQPGDLLESIPPASSDRDIYLLSAVLHGFDDTDSLKALRNLADAVGTTGARIALLEMVLPESQADLTGATFDMQMLMGTRGRERTLSQWSALFEEAGLVREEVVALKSFAKILVLRAKPIKAAGIT